MSVTLKQVETIATYPGAPTGLSTAAAALDPNFIWQRIEAYICHRYSERPVVWTVEGPGEWQPPLTPATITEAQVWAGAAWVTVDLAPAPDGFKLVLHGPYKITATVGGGAVPAAVSEAYRRLAEYSVDTGKDGMASGHTSHTSRSVSIGGEIDISFSRAASWAARAIITSGAGDLLRPYRRAS